jgi:hypothetical protein
MPHHSKLDNDGDGRQRALRRRTRGRAVRLVITLAGTAALALAAATPALASSSGPAQHYARAAHDPAILLVVVTPSPNDIAGAGGVFNVDLAALAKNATGNNELSAANGYKPGILSPAQAGVGKTDPFAPGLVVLLSTTKTGANKNLAGVFQLTDVASHHGLTQVFADWEVGKANAFGTPGTKVTLTAFLVSGTAPGTVTGSVTPISNVIKETFTIG